MAIHSKNTCMLVMFSIEILSLCCEIAAIVWNESESFYCNENKHTKYKCSNRKFWSFTIISEITIWLQVKK